jgi:SAM-dependent methyltransferase
MCHPVLVSLPVTGERTVPGVAHENYWFRRHEVAYRAAAELCRNARVLEAGAGEGYGAAALAERGAGAVVALDYDAVAASHAATTYGVTTVRGNLVALPFRDGCFDVVVSLQTIEHLWDQPAFLSECARALRPGGRLILSTPNRLTFPPGNPFHPRELSVDDLAALIDDAPLRTSSLLGVHHGPRLKAYPGDLVADQLHTEPDQWPAALAEFVAAITADDFVLTTDDIDASLDLYLVAVRA